MKVATLILCVLALLVAKAAALRYHKRVGIPTATKIRQQEISTRIAGGLVSYRGEHPFFAGLLISLKSGETSVCGGALVSNVYVVTIGQCWYDGESEGRSMEVVLGSNSLYEGGIRHIANWTMLHPEYDPDYLVNDVALVRIPFTRNITDYVTPILLPSYYSSDFEGRLAQVIGLGMLSAAANPGGNQSVGLHDVYVTIMKNFDCLPYYGTAIKYFSNAICTSGSKNKGACSGDYGGPLILRRYSSGKDMLIGLVSITSPAGCDAGDPTGYTRIAPYRRWLNSYL